MGRVRCQMEEKALRVLELTRKYKRGGVFDVTFDVERGEIVGICGGEQSGKTTLLRAVAGMCVPDSGRISVFGIDALNNHIEAAARIGSVIEEPVFYDYMTAEQNMRAAARLYGTPDGERIDEILVMMGLELCKKDRPCDFTPAMRMKLALGLAFLTEPELILLDEPFGALTETDCDILTGTVLEMNRDMGTTFVITSRSIDELSGFCDKIGTMEKGRLTAFDIPKNILERELEEGGRLFEQSIEEEKAVSGS